MLYDKVVRSAFRNSCNRFDQCHYCTHIERNKLIYIADI